MSYSGDAAEQVVRMSLEGAEVAAKITGAGAKQVAVLLYAILREQKKTKGKTRLTNMLRSGKELKVFAVKDTDLKQFCEASKKYGVLYCVLKDRNADDGITDVMVRAEDASKINRIFERFQLATVDMGSVKSEIERSRREKAAEEFPEPERSAAESDKTAQLVDSMLQKPDKEQEGHTPNPAQARTTKSPQSEPMYVPELNLAIEERSTDERNHEQKVKRYICELQDVRYILYEPFKSAEDAAAFIRTILKEHHVHIKTAEADDIALCKEKYNLLKRRKLR